MKFKTAHAKILSLLLTLVMVLSTAAVFAEGEESAPASEPVMTALEDQSVEAADENNETVPAEEAGDVDQIEEPVMDVAEAAQITVDPTSATVKIGKTTQLTATTVDSTAIVEWSSSADAVATVSETGLVTGVAEGSATITATIKDTEYSASCEVTVPAKPAAPTGVDSSIRHGKGDNGVTVKWTKNGADSYIVMRGTDKNNLKVFKPVSGSSESYYWLESKGNFYYAVVAVKDGEESEPSEIVNENISGNILPTIQELTWYSHTKKKVTLYRTAKLKGKVATLPKGTYVQAIGKSPKKVKKFKQPSKVQVRAKVNGKTVTGWVKYNQLKGGVKAATTVSQDFTPSALEDFVNEHGYSSPNKYLIWVSPRTQRAYLFTGEKGSWKLSDRFRVTTGRFSHKTAPYHSAISKKKAKVWMVTEKGKRYYYKTASYFASGVSFHTGTWWANGKVRGVMNKKGVPQTFGCLRMANSEAGWIYNHVPVGTTVIVKKDAA